MQELELITSDFKDASHFVHGLLMCCQPAHCVKKIRIAQSPLIPDRPWERAHRILYDRPSHNQLVDHKSDPGKCSNPTCLLLHMTVFLGRDAATFGFSLVVSALIIFLIFHLVCRLPALCSVHMSLR
jgi:hypothetical protein